jgi:hypothetical protein
VIGARLNTDVLKEPGEVLETDVEVMPDAGCGYARLIIRHQGDRSRVVNQANRRHLLHQTIPTCRSLSSAAHFRDA